MTRILTIALALAILAAGIQTWRLDRAAIAALRKEQERNIQIAAMQRQTDMEAADYEKERKEMEDRADSADASLRRLQQAILSAGWADPEAPGGVDGGAKLRTALGECAARYGKMALIADGYRAQLVTLQGWARTVAP